MTFDLVISGGQVYTPVRIIPNGMVGISEGRIAYCGAPAELESNVRLNATGKIVAPGFVDLHVHGGDGGDFIDGKESAVRKALRHHAMHGTTALLATTSTAAMPKIFQAFDMLGSVMGKEGAAAQILGIHMEGPYFAKPEPGCHVLDLIHDPNDEDEIERLVSYASLIKRITIAPEIEGALPFIRRMSRLGIVMSGGHSNATYEEVRRGVEEGITHLTHHWSAMSGVRRVNAKRFSGMVEAGLLCDDLTTEIIADGRHLPTSLLRLAFKCKGPAGVCLVSDAMRASGLPEGTYEVCEMQAVVENGVALTLDRRAFASSIITLDFAVRHMVQTVGLPLLDVLRMASLTPAEIAGVADRKGSLSAGKDADVLILDPKNLDVETVLVKGKPLE